MKYPIFYPSNLKSKTISYSFPYNLLRYFFKSTNLLFYSLSQSHSLLSQTFSSLSLSLSLSLRVCDREVKEAWRKRTIHHVHRTGGVLCKGGDIPPGPQECRCQGAEQGTVIFFVLDIIVLGKTMCSSGLCISFLQTIFLLLHHGACPFLESNLPTIIMGYLESCTVCMMCSDRFYPLCCIHTAPRADSRQVFGRLRDANDPRQGLS